jgi:serine/threonine protein kinase
MSEVARTYEERLVKYRHLVKAARFIQDKNICVRESPIPLPRGAPPDHPRFLVDTKSQRVYFATARRLKERHDKDSMDGEAHVICFLDGRVADYKSCPVGGVYAAIKVMPLTVAEAGSPGDPEKPAWREIEILRMCTEMVVKGVCPNLPVYYAHTVCNSTDPGTFQNSNILKHYDSQDKVDRIRELVKQIDTLTEGLAHLKVFVQLKEKIQADTEALDDTLSDYYSSGKQYSTSSVLIINELCHFDFRNHMFNISLKLTSHPAPFIFRVIDTYILQVLIGLRALNGRGVIHFDLHLGNLLVTILNAAHSGDPIQVVYWHYRVDGTDYYVPYYDSIVKLWDFGRSVILPRDQALTILKAAKNGKRFFPPYYKRYTRQITDNLNAHFDRYVPLLQSFDTHRFLDQTLHSLSKVPVQPGLLKLTAHIERMCKLAKDDITRGLRQAPGDGRSPLRARGNPATLIHDFYRCFTKLPAGMKVANEKKPYIIGGT